ncbi:MAG: hypothetical protein GPJ52_06535 [Candidatus Heimdallarchaeota archaeon]|nr:hypothetical protein [Candidatus Heimdallarchaeota archaeon]
MYSKKNFCNIKLISYSLIIILFLLFSPIDQSKLYSRNSSISNNPRIIDKTASINNIQVPIISLDVAVKDSYAYLIGEYYFSYYNLEKPSPEFEGFMRDPYRSNITLHAVNQIEIQNNYMYILEVYSYHVSPIANLYVAEILNPYTIDILGNHSFNASINTELYSKLHELVIVDDYAFIGTSWYNKSNDDLSLVLTSIIDISNKSNPFGVGSYLDSGVLTDLTVKNDKIFLTMSAQRRYNVTDNHSPYYVGENLLVILDIANKSQPTKIFQQNLSHRPCSVAIQNKYLYLSFYDSGLEIYDIEDIVNPVLHVSTNIESRKIVFDENIAYVLENEKLKIFDTTEVNKLKKIGEKMVRFRGENGAFHDCVVENNLVLAIRIVQYYGPFIIFDCSNIKNPKIIYPEVDDDALRYELKIIIFGYVISPVIIFSLLTLVTRLLFLKRKKKEVLTKNGV